MLVSILLDRRLSSSNRGFTNQAECLGLRIQAFCYLQSSYRLLLFAVPNMTVKEMIRDIKEDAKKGTEESLARAKRRTSFALSQHPENETLLALKEILS